MEAMELNYLRYDDSPIIIAKNVMSIGLIIFNLKKCDLFFLIKKMIYDTYNVIFIDL